MYAPFQGGAGDPCCGVWERRAEGLAAANEIPGCVDVVSHENPGEVGDEGEDTVDALLACVVASICAQL